jgi:uncharacterized protein
MRLNEVNYDTAPPIDGYGPGFFRVGGEVLQGPRLLGPDLNADWDGRTPDAILALAGKIDVLLLGLGSEITAPPEALVAALDAAGIGVDFMATPPACRTYNVLLGEGRRIAAALIPVS